MSSDVVIVGGGVMGCSIAYFLTADPSFDGTVTVLERDPSLATASSALSASSIRQQFSTEINILVSRFGISFLREVGRHLAVDDEAPEIGLVEPGYLYLASPEGAAILEGNHRIQRALDVAVALLTPDELRARFPWLSLEGVVAGSLGLEAEGWYDGYGLTRAFRRKARTQGAQFITGEVVGMERSGDRVTAVTMASGERIACGTVVNAAGPRARLVAAMAGVALPVEARKRCVFVLDCKTPLPDCPLVIDTSGIWFRPEGARFITGMAPAAERDPEDFDLEVDHALFEEEMWPALATRVPAFEAVKVVGAWAGHYEYNTVDQNGLVGAHPALSNMLFANGFSGHGLQQSPAIGRGIAELITHGAYRSLDLSPLSVARLVEGRQLRELNII